MGLQDTGDGAGSGQPAAKPWNEKEEPKFSQWRQTDAGSQPCLVTITVNDSQWLSNESNKFVEHPEVCVCLSRFEKQHICAGNCWGYDQQ